MKIFITGIAGFIGSHVAELLLERGHDVAGCDNLVTGSAPNVPAGARWLPYPLSALRAVECDVVIHLAAITSARWPRKGEVWETNVGATVHALDVAGPARFLFASTAAHASGSPYGRSKAAAEELVRARAGTVLRLANVYGPRQRDWGPEPGVLAAWHRASREGRSIRVDGDGKQLRDFIHVFDVARAFALAAESDAAIAGETFDICTGRLSTIREAALSFAPERDWDHGTRAADDPDVVEQDPGPALERFGFCAHVSPPWTAQAPS